MKILFLIVMSFTIPALSNLAEEKRELICDQFSDAQCFAKEVDSICLFEAQKGQAGFCRPQITPYETDLVTCYCL